MEFYHNVLYLICDNNEDYDVKKLFLTTFFRRLYGCDCMAEHIILEKHLHSAT